MLEQPDSRPTPGGYRLQDEYRYEWDHGGRRYAVVVPAGFEYDGASVPRIVWTVSGILPDGLQRPAALIHDWLYVHCGQLPEGSFLRRVGPGRWVPVTARWSRKASDRMFGRLLLDAGFPLRKRRWAYMAVRLFGWTTWYVRLLRNYWSSSQDFS